MSVLRLDNIGVVVADMRAAIAFFEALGLALEGRTAVEGAWVDGVVGLPEVRSEIAVLATPDGHGRIELMTFVHPPARGEGGAPVNTFGIRRIAFAVDDLDSSLAAVAAHGATLMGTVEQYQDAYRLCYVRGPEGIIVMLAQPLG